MSRFTYLEHRVTSPDICSTSWWNILEALGYHPDVPELYPWGSQDISQTFRGCIPEALRCLPDVLGKGYNLVQNPQTTNQPLSSRPPKLLRPTFGQFHILAGKLGTKGLG